MTDTAQPGTAQPCTAHTGPSAFDAHHPPRADLLADCVHCGFCLPTCPTYLLWGEEMDSPRGRIHLMNLAARGEIGLGETVRGHIDACLGCMACVTACPSGVRYDRLIEAVRPQVDRLAGRTRSDRWFRGLIFALFPYPRRLRLAASAIWLYQRSGLRRLAHRGGLARLLPPRLRAMESLVPAVSLSAMATRLPVRTPATGARRRTVAMLTGCVQRVFFAEVNAATVRVLAAEGCEVIVPPGQECCGALSVHSGRDEEGRSRARRLIDAFEREQADSIVVNVAGCGSTLKEYGDLLADDPEYAERAARFAARVTDVSELLADLGPAAPRHPIAARVAYHDACHLAHAQGVRSQPRAVLATIPGLDVADIAEADICCGSAGIYNLVQPQAAEQLGRRKAANISATGADAVITSNPGCLLQIERHLGQPVPVLHLVQLLDAAIRGSDPLREAR